MASFDPNALFEWASNCPLQQETAFTFALRIQKLLLPTILTLLPCKCGVRAALKIDLPICFILWSKPQFLGNGLENGLLALKKNVIHKIILSNKCSFFYL